MLVVACGILHKKNRFLIAQRSKDDEHHPLRWEFPGGKKRYGESGEECIIRELEEELGIQVRVQELYSKTVIDDVTFIHFILEWVTGDITLNEHEDVKWVPVEDLTEYDLLDVDLEVASKLAERKEQ
jgi:8-oxo-dGTP diphosphatase